MIASRKRNLYPCYITQCPMWDKQTLTSKRRPLAIRPPHETLEAIIDSGNEAHFTTFHSTQAAFHSDLAAWASQLMITLTGAWACLALWGDMAPSTKSDSIMLLLFTIMNGFSRQRYWVTCLNKSSICQCGCFGRCTFTEIFSVVAWSARALAARRWPRVDHLGRLFPFNSFRRRMGGKRLRVGAAILRKYGDWEWFKRSLNLRGWGDGTRRRCCWLCGAS